MISRSIVARLPVPLAEGISALEFDSALKRPTLSPNLFKILINVELVDGSSPPAL